MDKNHPSMQFDENDSVDVFGDVNLEEMEAGMANGMSFNAKIDDSIAFNQDAADDTMIQRLEEGYSFDEHGRAAGPVSGEIVAPNDDEAESFFKNMNMEGEKGRMISVIKNDTKLFDAPVKPEVQSKP